MNHRTLAALAFCEFALTGCTVHHHYYATAGPATPYTSTAPEECPGRAVLTDQLAGVHTAIEVTATNLANLNTLGYKARRATFIEGRFQPRVSFDWTQGSPQITHRELDVYIEGEGFFKIEIPYEAGGGEAYTRAGQFFINRDRELVVGGAEGPRLAACITVPMDAMGIAISPDGTVTVALADKSILEIGQIQIYRFMAPDALEPIGEGLYAETVGSGPPCGSRPGRGSMGALAQGMIESSNVYLIMEIVELKKLRRWADAIADELDLHRDLYSPATDSETPDELGILLSHDD